MSSTLPSSISTRQLYSTPGRVQQQQQQQQGSSRAAGITQADTEASMAAGLDVVLMWLWLFAQAAAA
jgi:hypothetical protein